MSRFFNNQEVELLAPAGNFEIFKEIIDSGADAVYIGGKSFNMRLHRPHFNFSNEEIIKAVQMAHERGKKLYVTVNNLLNENEHDEAIKFLTFLDSANVDAVLVADLGMVQLIRDLGLKVNIHSSVMMNVHNAEMIKQLQQYGVTRIVASRNMDLNAVKDLYNKTGIEIEYFAHGDLCFMHDSQCLYSGILFGQSGNRGLCLMPCRWHYSLKKDNKLYPHTQPLSSKDMYMYENIPELIDAGVVSFKIEGRMRDAEYLLNIINRYSEAIDRYIEDPIHFERKQESDYLIENRHRDLTTGFSFGKPGTAFCNNRNTVNGQNFATKKFFSDPAEEREITTEKVNKVREFFTTDGENKKDKPQLAVKVNTYEQALIALEENVDILYLSGNVFKPHTPFTKEQILALANKKGSTKLYLGLPTMMMEPEFAQYTHLLKSDLGIDGILATNLGAVSQFGHLNLDIRGDYSLNIYNSYTTKLYKNFGLSAMTMQLETKTHEALPLFKHSLLPVEMIIHGAPTALYMEHDLFEHLNDIEPVSTTPSTHPHQDALFLVDHKGYEHPVYKDQLNRNHMLMYKDLCHLPLLKELHDNGVKTFRIESTYYTPESLKNIIGVYKKALANLDNCEMYLNELTYPKVGLTLGAFAL